MRVSGALLAAAFLSCGGPGGPAAPTTSVTGASAGVAAAVPATRPGPPDIILILADDMGWGDLGAYGNPTVNTPNIDKLAAEGSRFEAMYVPTPICAPSRASLLTGRYGVRNGVTWNNNTTIKTSEITMAQLLRTQGYATGMVGKWHLGAKVAEMPQRLGFDSFYGMLSSSHAHAS